MENEQAVAGLIVNRIRKKSAVWDVVLVEEMPLVGGIVSDATAVGTGFTSDDGTIRLAIKKGLSIQGSIELRPKK